MAKRKKSIFEKKSPEQLEKEHNEWVKKLKQEGNYRECTKEDFMDALDKAAKPRNK